MILKNKRIKKSLKKYICLNVIIYEINMKKIEVIEDLSELMRLKFHQILFFFIGSIEIQNY